MSDAPAAPSAPSLAPSESLLQYLAIGRLATNKEGTLLPEKHRLVAHNFARKDDPDPEYAKSIKSHLKAVLKRAGHKLTPGKRIRLKDDAARYEVHILTDEAEGDRAKTLVFFAVTAVDFPKYHSVPSLLKDLKGGFYATVDKGTLWQGGSVQRACQPYFARLSRHYATSVLSSVQAKADSVKEVMASSVARALHSVETLEDMDEKAEMFEDKSKTFFKRAEEVKVIERSKYRKLTILLALGVLAVIAYLVYTAVDKYKLISGDDDEDSSSSSTGEADPRSSTGEEEGSTGVGDGGAGRRLLALRLPAVAASGPGPVAHSPASDEVQQAAAAVLLGSGQRTGALSRRSPLQRLQQQWHVGASNLRQEPPAAL